MKREKGKKFAEKHESDTPINRKIKDSIMRRRKLEKRLIYWKPHWLNVSWDCSVIRQKKRLSNPKQLQIRIWPMPFGMHGSTESYPVKAPGKLPAALMSPK